MHGDERPFGTVTRGPESCPSSHRMHAECAGKTTDRVTGCCINRMHSDLMSGRACGPDTEARGEVEEFIQRVSWHFLTHGWPSSAPLPASWSWVRALMIPLQDPHPPAHPRGVQISKPHPPSPPLLLPQHMQRNHRSPLVSVAKSQYPTTCAENTPKSLSSLYPEQQ